MAAGKSCLLARTSKGTSRSSSAAKTLSNSSLASVTRLESVESTTNMMASVNS
eukprot:GABW01000981.1.p3 GENE.GABW01000981.1~~GABW01000981.1.p3  ORF type:complete len:53 (-),score=4.48 GABW01000981.1:89-247(-)